MNRVDQRIGKNIYYNVILQLSTMLLMVLSTPYLARVLGAEGLGAYAYTYTIVQYFVLAGTLGTTTYGTRQVAFSRQNIENLSKTFWNIFFFRIILTSIIIIFYIIFFLVFPSKYKILFFMQLIVLFSNQLDISWLFSGLEDFKKIAIRGTVVKIIAFILIFPIVKKPSDIWKYTLIQGGSMLVGNLALWVYFPRELRKPQYNWQAIKEHLFPAIKLFIPQVAIGIYVLFDKTMLGAMTSASQVGFYDKAERFAKLPLSFIGILSTVMLPVMSSFSGENNIEMSKKYLFRSLQMILLISIASGFGMAGIAPQFVPWMLGEGFTESIALLIILAALTPIISISNIIGRLYLIPFHQEKQLTISVLCGAGSNIILNLLFIPKWQAIGACIATLITESVVSIVQYSFLYKQIDNKLLGISIIKSLIAGIVMFFVIHALGLARGPHISTTFLQIIVGTIVYISILLLLQEKAILKLLKSVHQTALKYVINK